MTGVLIDDREDTSLVNALKCFDFETITARLEYGDACFEGHGPRGPALIGIERKKLNDVIQSMTDRRLSGHQLRGMWQCYDYCYLVIEDMWRPDDIGGIEVIQGGKWKPYCGSTGHGCTYRQVQSYLSTLEVVGGLIVLRSYAVRETAAIYASRVHWWAKEWKEHKSHDEIYAPGPEVQQTRGKASFVSRTPGLIEKVAAQLPGIDKKAWEVGKRFRSVEEMVMATEKEWMEVPGIGKGIAKEVVKAMRVGAGK